MKITLLQQNVVWTDWRQNLRNADEAIGRHPGADLYVLPEMFSTGCCTRPEELLRSEGGETLRWMKRKAAETDAAVAGSVAVEEDGKYYNRFCFVKPDGQVAASDKRHLFSYGGENHCYTAGRERTVTEFRGVRILLLVCYDLRFPVWSRNRDDYDLAIYVAAWPAVRIEVWNTLLRARAIENQCYVAGVNRVGSDPVCEYSGGTQLVDAFGKVVAACPDGTEGAVEARLDLKRLKTFRRKFPVLDDADCFEALNAGMNE